MGKGIVPQVKSIRDRVRSTLRAAAANEPLRVQDVTASRAITPASNPRFGMPESTVTL
jgi:hypothetical protein